MESSIPMKTVLVGDSLVGKTCMIMSNCCASFPDDYLPKVFDNYTANRILGNKTILLSIWDTPSDNDKLRELSYPLTEVFSICFSLVNKISFDNVLIKWIPEINAHVIIFIFYFLILYFYIFVF
jgi:small GTP-binding protein